MRYLCIVLICLFVGCENGSRGTNSDGSSTVGTFSKCNFEGHSYIVYSEGVLDHRIGGLEHDPNCNCERK